MLVGPLPSVLHWVRPIGSMERRLEETHFYLTGSLLVGSLKTDRRSQLLSGGPPTQGLPPTPPLPAPPDLVLSPSDASPMPLLLLSIAPLLHSSKILSLSFFICMSSSSCSFSPWTIKRNRKEEKKGGERERRKVEGEKETINLCFVNLLRQSKRCLWMLLPLIISGARVKGCGWATEEALGNLRGAFALDCTKLSERLQFTCKLLLDNRPPLRLACSGGGCCWISLRLCAGPVPVCHPI